LPSLNLTMTNTPLGNTKISPIASYLLLFCKGKIRFSLWIAKLKPHSFYILLILIICTHKKITKNNKNYTIGHAKMWIGAKKICEGIGNVFKKYILTMN